MSKIIDVIGREILDSRGNPTVEVDVILESGVVGRASVPSGASTGKKEALELRDNDLRYNGKGVLKAVSFINNELKNVVVGNEVFDQESIDQAMIKLDGTNNKSKFGANAILGISMAVLKATALESEVPLYKYISDGRLMPKCMMNIINGGVHADNKLDIQEFMIIPIASNVHDRIRIGVEIFHTLKGILKSKGFSTNVGDEGGFAPNLDSNHQAFDLIIEAVNKAGYKIKDDVLLGIDVAANELYENNVYNLNGKKYTTYELVDYYIELCDKYPICSIEDPFSETDFEGFKLLTEKIGDYVQIVGDDLFVTNKEYLQNGIRNKMCNAILIKLNQIGTITEALETILLAKENGYSTIISHRSGETEDTIIADMAVSLNLGQIKTGSLSRTDRVCKYNQLMRIEEEIEKETN